MSVGDDDRGASPTEFPTDVPAAKKPPKLLDDVLERLQDGRRAMLEADGSTFGPFVLLGEISRGGMGAVQLAVDPRDERQLQLVVIKWPHQVGEHRDIVRREMFEQEVQVQACLQHPNVVHLIDSGVIEERPYATFELVDGLSLRQVQRLFEPSCLPLTVTLEIGVQIATALDYIHTARDASGRPLDVVHRDVTPHNVLLERNGRVKLADFGIARFAGRDIETKAGIVRGKAGYLAPEQTLSAPVDGRVDVFALGLVLVELISGEAVLPNITMVIEDCSDAVRDLLRKSPEFISPDLEATLLAMTRAQRDGRLWPARAAAERLFAARQLLTGPDLPEWSRARIFSRLLPLDLPTLAEPPTLVNMTKKVQVGLPDTVPLPRDGLSIARAVEEAEEGSDTDPNPEPEDEATVKAPPHIESAPTPSYGLGSWGIVLLILLVAGLGWWLMGRGV